MTMLHHEDSHQRHLTDQRETSEEDHDKGEAAAGVLLEKVRKLAQEKVAAESEATALKRSLTHRDARIRVLAEENKQALSALEACTADTRRCRADLHAFVVKMKKQLVKSQRAAMAGRELPWETMNPQQRDLAEQLEDEREKHRNLARKVKVWEQYLALEKSLVSVETRARDVANSIVPDTAKGEACRADNENTADELAALTKENKDLHEELFALRAQHEFKCAEHAAEQASTRYACASKIDDAERRLVAIQAKATAEVAALKQQAQEDTEALVLTREGLERDFKRRLQKNKQTFQDEMQRRDKESILREKLKHAEKTTEVAELRAQHEKVLRGERAKHEAKLKQVRAHFEASKSSFMKNALAKHKSELDELNQMHEERFEGLRLELVAKSREEKSAHEQELKVKLQGVRDESTRTLERLKDDHKGVVERLERNLREAVADERMAAQRREGELRAQMSALLEQTKDLHAETIGMLNADHAAAMQRSLHNHSEVLKTAHEEFAIALARQAGHLESSIDQAASQAMETAEKAWREEKLQLERSWDARLVTLADTHKANIEDLEEQFQHDLDAVQKEREELRTETDALARERESLRAQLEEQKREATEAVSKARHETIAACAEEREQEVLLAKSEQLRLEKKHQEEVSQLLLDHEREVKKTKLDVERRALMMRREMEVASQAQAMEQHAMQEQRVVELREQLRVVEQAMDAQTERFRGEMARVKQTSEDQLAKVQHLHAATLEKHLGKGFEAIANKLAEEPRSPKLEQVADKLQGQHLELQNALGTCMQRIEALVQEDHDQLKKEREAQQEEAKRLAETKLADLEANRTAMKREHEEHIAEVEARFKVQLAQSSSEKEELQRLIPDFQAHIKKLEAELVEAGRLRQDALEEQESKLAAAFKSKAKEAASHAAKELENLRALHASEREAMQKDHAIVLETSVQEAEGRLRTAHEKSLSSLRGSHEARMQELPRKHVEASRVLESNWEQRVRALELEQYKLSMVHQEERTKLQESNAEARRRSLAELKANLRQDHESAMHQLRVQHRQEVESQSSLHASTVRTLHEEHHAALAQAREHHRDDLNALQRKLEIMEHEHKVQLKDALREQARDYESRMADLIRAEDLTQVEPSPLRSQLLSTSVRSLASSTTSSSSTSSSSSSSSSSSTPSPSNAKGGVECFADAQPDKEGPVNGPGGERAGGVKNTHNGFKVAESDGYEEYIDRDTGETFWLHTSSQTIHRVSPRDRARILGLPEPHPADEDLLAGFRAQRETLLVQMCTLHVLKTKIQDLERRHEETLYNHIQERISQRSSVNSADEHEGDTTDDIAVRQILQDNSTADEEEEKGEDNVQEHPIARKAVGKLGTEESDEDEEVVEFSASPSTNHATASVSADGFEAGRKATTSSKRARKASEGNALQAQYRQKLAAERQFAFDILLTRKDDA
ncbi:Laminin-like protein epi-1 [Hondaea fermentalgiana]|uniref:Laminin-like protein epi-1 n=1 Tax=Hondaea fermentalgiana TaxID=2315210 RepID=A0A2R5GXW0_9STRA|nr:Laminin-like protein epi-1 [Hondaea fermentalgiana]|eukprot:GBG34628.1 Laminin-like protein epi-1 [Hondaea fermentalgiana]